jgi:hypothetical protein
MRSLLNKIFAGRLGLGKFFISGIAFLLGLTLVLVSVQFYIKIDTFLNPKKNLSGYLILNKEVGLGNTIFGSKAEFSKEEVDDIRQQEFVEDLGVFNSNHFNTRAFIGGDVGFQTELFFESIPDRFLDDKPYNFKWNPESEFLPIIISQDFLNLYNFGYALGRGTPQLSKSTIGLVPFSIEVSGPNGKRIFNGKVVGFSERVPSVLVPNDFLEWANAHIGNQKIESASRLIIKVRGDKGSEVMSYLDEHGLKVGSDKLQLSKLSNIVSIVMTIIFGVGTAFILFALVIVVMNFSLIITEAKDEIKLLFQLGYKNRYLLNHLLIYLSCFIASVGLISVILFIIINETFTDFLKSKSIEINSSIEIMVYFSGSIFIIISYLISIFFIYKVLKKNS